MTAEKEYLTSHRAHDYKALIRRWRAVAKKTGLRLTQFFQDGDYPLFYLEPNKPRPGRSLYLSGGIHGDEPASPQGLIHWAEADAAQVDSSNLIIFPCLNPWGLENNQRANERGRDLNREFQNPRVGLVGAWRKVIGKSRFDLAVSLHEDYDAQGVYIYELSHRERLAERVIEAVTSIIPPDRRRSIDGSRANTGVIRRRVTPENFPLPGLPEAVYLQFHHATASLTIETPSQFSLHSRVRAHAKALQVLVRTHTN